MLYKKTVETRLRRRLPYKFIGGYFYSVSDDDIMFGVCVEYPPAILKVWKYAIPFYDRVSFLHLTLGSRILVMRRDDIGNDEEAISRIQETILAADAELRMLGSLEGLLSWLNSRALGSVSVRRARAATNIMLGNVDEAREDLQILAINPLGPAPPHFAEEVRLIQDSLDEGIEVAITLLKTWGSKSKMELLPP